MSLERSTKKTPNIILFLSTVVLTSVYVFAYSRSMSFDSLTMRLLYVMISVLIFCLDSEYILYALCFFLPLRKAIYFGSLAIFNIVLVAIFLKLILFRKKLPIKSLILAMCLASYDMCVSALALYEDYQITLYMLKWYFSFFVFLALIECGTSKFDYRKATVFLNLGLIVTGVLTMYQYAGYTVISSSLREELGGAGGTLDQNSYAFFCLMGFVSAIGYILDPSVKEKKNWWTVALMGLLGLFNLLCGMYMVSKAFYVVLIALIVLIVCYSIRNLKNSFWYILLVAVAFVMLMRTDRAQGLLESIMLRFGKATDIDTLTTGRSELLFYYLGAVVSSPIHFIFGAGLSTYSRYYEVPNQTITHNTPLEVFAAWGFVGFVFITIVLYSFLKRYIYTRSRKNSLYSLLPLLTMVIFSFSLSMFWEDASLFFIVFSLYYSIHLKTDGKELVYEKETA